MLQKPVFLHSSWRSASTYVWAKFRALPEACCYFEPLNEHLASELPAFIDTFMPWDYANHPKLDAPYLEEFRPLFSASGGIPAFPAELTYGRFRLGRESHIPELEAYFATLSRFAESLEKTPVFGCVRTNLRIDWFRHHLKGIHIVLMRDPRRQFISSLNQAVKGNRYFLERGWVILGNNLSDPDFAPLRELLEVPVFEGSPDQRDGFYRRLAWETEWSKLYIIFYFLHLLALKNLHPDSFDLLIDLDQLSVDPEARRKTESAVEALTGARISFVDCRIELYEERLKSSGSAFAELERMVARQFS